MVSEEILCDVDERQQGLFFLGTGAGEKTEINCLFRLSGSTKIFTLILAPLSKGNVILRNKNPCLYCEVLSQKFLT